jgi:putative endopeptidase
MRKHVTNTFRFISQNPATAQANAAKQWFWKQAPGCVPAQAQACATPTPTNKMSVAQLTSSPRPDWKTWLTLTEFTGVDTVIGQPEFYRTLPTVWHRAPLDTVVGPPPGTTRTFSPTLSSQFVDENFRFYSTVLRGAKAIWPAGSALDMAEDVHRPRPALVKEYPKPRLLRYTGEKRGGILYTSSSGFG